MTANFLKLMQVRRLATVLLLGGMLAGCSTYNSATRRIVQYITPYRVTIVQGNFVSNETAAKLHAGMTREEVRALLGTPLLADMFHASRWDYVFYFKRGNRAIVQQRDLIVHFDGDRLASWSGAEDLPSEFELLSEIDGDRKAKTLTEQASARKAAEAKEVNAASGAAASTATGSTPASAAAASGTPASAAATPASAASAVPANQAAAATANRATEQGPSPASGPPPNAIPPAVANSPLQGTPSSGRPANSQFRLQAPSLQHGSGAPAGPGLGY